MIENQRLPSLFHTLIPKPRNQDHRSATERVITQKSTRQNHNLKNKKKPERIRYTNALL